MSILIDLLSLQQAVDGLRDLLDQLLGRMLAAPVPVCFDHLLSTGTWILASWFA